MDALGRPLAVTDPYGQTVGYEWGSMGERKALTYPDGTRAAYEYDEAMHLAKLHTPTGEITYEYDEAGRLREKQLPGGIVTQYAYNSLGRIAQISHEGENVHERYIYYYDAAGNKIGADKERSESATWKERTSCNEKSTVNGSMLDSGSYRYAYDALNRLVGVEKDGNTQREYSYDAFGNRTKKVDYTIPVLSGEAESGVETTLYCYNNANQLIAEQLETSGISKAAREKVYRYDRRGNLVEVCQGEELLKQFTFDPANRMSGSAASADGIWKQATYQYNGLGQRVGQEIWNSLQNPEQSIRYTLDLTKQYHNLLHLGDMQNGKNQTFYWDGNVVSMQEDGEESLYLQDDLGSPVELLNAEGGIREHYAFDEFGTSLNLGEQMQPFGFTGYQMDVAGGLYFAQARRYDASTGRFVSEDKVKGFADAPFTLNPYSYCWNKPMELVDLKGLYPVAGVTAEVGEDLNEQTHPSGPTAGVTSDIGDALRGGGYSGYSSCDSEGTDISDFLEEIGESVSLNSNVNDIGQIVFDVSICQKQYNLSVLWKEIKNAGMYKAVDQSLGNFRRATRAKIKVIDEELEALGKNISDIGKASGVLNVISVGIDVGIGFAENVENDALTSKIASDVLVDITVSGLEIGVTAGISTIVASVVTGFVAGTAVPGIGNLVGAVVGLIVGIGLVYFIDIKEYEEGKTGRDKIKETVYDSLIGEEG